MKKLVIIPAYNEKDNIISTVKEIEKEAPDYDYIIINDCSTDNTLDLIRYNGYDVLNLPVNLGIGGAVQTGYFYAYSHHYDIAVQIDADGQHDVSYLSAMEKHLLENNCDMVIGSRFIDKKGFQSSGPRRIGINFFNHLLFLLFRIRITDPTSGFRMCNQRTIAMFANEYPRDYPEPESTARLLRHKRKVEEEAVIMRKRRGGVSSISMMRSVYYMFKVTLAIIIERFR